MVARNTQVQAGLAEQGLDALLGWRTAELVMLAGCFPHFGLSLCLYPRAGQPIVYAPVSEPPAPAREDVIRRNYTIGPGDGWSSLRALLHADLDNLGLARRAIGVCSDLGRQALPANAAETPPLTEATILTLLDGYTVHANDAVDAFWSELFLHKTTEDVAAIRRANAVAAEGVKRFYSLVAAGLSEAEIAGQVEAAIQAQTGRSGCASARGWAFVQAGEAAAQAGTFSRSTGTVLKEGDMVVLELATCVDGYWSDLTRTAVAGPPSPNQKALLAAVRAAQSAAIAAVHAGALHCDVDAAARQVLEQRGYGAGFTHATGHHVGFRYHDAGPMLAPGSRHALEEGMVITVEPGAYDPAYGGCRIEDNVLVTKDGCAILSPHSLQG